ncbi:MAG TPA: DUF5615 family PIN-like protein [Flavisolibacter sp.]|nr:DUF5615 family PIN-like protein [Flavisolibacter sp.]
MKLLIDQNISFRITKAIVESFPGSLHVSDAGLINASDSTIRKFAIDHDFAIVTFDDDFNKYNQLYGPPPKIIWIRKGNLSNQQLVALLIEKKDDIRAFLETSPENETGILEIL